MTTNNSSGQTKKQTITLDVEFECQFTKGEPLEGIDTFKSVKITLKPELPMEGFIQVLEKAREWMNNYDTSSTTNIDNVKSSQIGIDIQDG